MTNPIQSLPHSYGITFGPELAAVPYLDQYFGEWAIDEAYGRLLASHAKSINLQLHLEQHAPKATAGGSTGRNQLAIDANGIAYIELSGTLMKHASSMSGGTSMALARRQVRFAASNTDVRGICLIIDSPGGTVAGVSDLAADIRTAASKKPLFAYIEDLGASAAYWLASQASRISMNATGNAGSIGVFTIVEDTSKAVEAEGVKIHVVRFGEMKGAGTPGTAITEEQLAYLQERINGIGDDFIGAIASGRKLSREAAAKLADGRIHKGEAAKKLGLVDAIESIDETLAALQIEIKKSASKSRSKANMATDPAQTEAEESKQPKAATVAQLKAACKGASSDFIVAQIEAGATVQEALSAHVAQMASEKEQLAKENDELKAKAAESAAKPGKRGVAPIAAGEGEEESNANAWSEVGANEFMQIKVEERMAKGQKRERAVASVFAAHPGLREAMVQEANANRKPR